MNEIPPKSPTIDSEKTDIDSKKTELVFYENERWLVVDRTDDGVLLERPVDIDDDGNITKREYTMMPPDRYKKYIDEKTRARVESLGRVAARIDTMNTGGNIEVGYNVEEEPVDPHPRKVRIIPQE